MQVLTFSPADYPVLQQTERDILSDRETIMIWRVGRNFVNWVASETRRRLRSSLLHCSSNSNRFSFSFSAFVHLCVFFSRAFVPSRVWLERNKKREWETESLIILSRSLASTGVRLDPDAESSLRVAVKRKWIMHNRDEWSLPRCSQTFPETLYFYQ